MSETYPPPSGRERSERRRNALPLPETGRAYPLTPGPKITAQLAVVRWIDGDGIHGRYLRQDSTDAGAFHNFTPANFWRMIAADAVPASVSAVLR